MTTSLSTLLAPQTEDQLFTALLATLTSLGFPVTSWQSGGAGRTLTRADARALADLHTAVAAVASGAYLDDATGDWLTLHAKSRFDLDRTAATFEEWDLAVTVASGAGPHTITPGALVGSTTTGPRFRSVNTANTTLPSAATTTVRVRAETSGAAGGTTAGTITVLSSPAWAGVTINNPTGPAVVGADAESDTALRARCRARWSTIGYGATAAAYQYWATTCPGAPAVTRAKCVSGPGNGNVTVYIATSGGAPTGGEVAAVQADINTRKPLTDTATVTAATVVTVALTGTITFSSATYNTTANQNVIKAALTALQGSLTLGSTVDLGAIYHACYAAAGVSDVDLTTPAADVVLTDSQVAAFTTTGLVFLP